MYIKKLALSYLIALAVVAAAAYLIGCDNAHADPPEAAAIADRVDPADPAALPAPAAAIDAPDPIEQPPKAWQLLLAMWKVGAWPGVAFALLLVSRAIVTRLEPKGEFPVPLRGWRGKVLAIASGLVAVSGAGLEFLVGTGGAVAVASALVFAIGVVIDAFDPKRGSKRKRKDDEPRRVSGETVPRGLPGEPLLRIGTTAALLIAPPAKA